MAGHAAVCTGTFGPFTNVCDLTYTYESVPSEELDELLDTTMGEVFASATAEVVLSQFDPAIGNLVALQWTAAIAAAAATAFEMDNVGDLFADSKSGAASGVALGVDIPPPNIQPILPVFTDTVNRIQSSSATNASNTCDSTTGDMCFSSLADYTGLGQITLAQAKSEAGTKVTSAEMAGGMAAAAAAASAGSITYYYTMTAVPLPAGLPLVLSGLGVFGVMGLRKRAAARR